jgi:16S rRNA (cytosine967-C5)-methyltransferase
MLASDYFRAKKYIGAHDRRFISQTVFASVRGYSAFSYCVHQAWQDVAAVYDVAAMGLSVSFTPNSSVALPMFTVTEASSNTFSNASYLLHGQTPYKSVQEEVSSLTGEFSTEVFSTEVLSTDNDHRDKQLTKQGVKRNAKHTLSTDTPLEELLVVATCCLLGNAVGVGNMSEALQELLGADATDIDERIIVIGENLAKHLHIGREVGMLFAQSACEHWSILEDEINAIVEEELSVGEPSRESLTWLSTRFAMPAWLLDTFGVDWFSSIELAASMLAAAPLVLRVNTLALSRQSLLSAFAEQGIVAKAGKLSPDSIIIERRVNLTQTPLYREGMVEIQDEASQLTAYAVSPQAGWTVLDACAGAGGKALHLATLMRGQGKIVASDVEPERLKELPFRAKRAGLRSIETVIIKPTDDAHILPEALKHLAGVCDAVLVDAPCSGSGTVRRSPMLKWRLSPLALEKHAYKQLALLSSFAAAVKPGGVLVYATCSVLPQENTDVIAAFLAEHEDFALEPLAPCFAVAGITVPGLQEDAGYLTLYPSIHGTDGFFLARMRRVA